MSNGLASAVIDRTFPLSQVRPFGTWWRATEAAAKSLSRCKPLCRALFQLLSPHSPWAAAHPVVHVVDLALEVRIHCGHLGLTKEVHGEHEEEQIEQVVDRSKGKQDERQFTWRTVQG